MAAAHTVLHAVGVEGFVTTKPMLPKFFCETAPHAPAAPACCADMQADKVYDVGSINPK